MKRMMKWTAVMCGFGLLLFGQNVLADDMSPPEMSQQQMEGATQQQEGYSQQRMDEQQQQGQQLGQQETRSMEGMRVSDMRRDDVMGRNVQDRSGNPVGTVSEAVTDDNDQINYIIVLRDQDNKMVPVPLDLLETQGSADDMMLVIDLDREQLRSAPSISRDEIRNFDQQEVRGYYDDLDQQ